MNYQPSFLDITIDFNTQFLPTVYLACKLKKLCGEQIYITLSGDVCPRLIDSLTSLGYLFDFFDELIIYDREEIISEFVNVISTKETERIKELPNMAYREGSRIILTKMEAVNCMERWNTPDYSDIPFKLYYAPEFEATVNTSYGCYWGKCKFCNIYLRNLRYNERSVKRVVDDIRILKDRHRIEVLAFGDEEVKAIRLFKIAEELINQGIEINWSAQARLEAGFSAEVCQRLKQSGCVYLGFGMESGCNETLERMNTGTERNVITQVLKNVKKAGIITNVSMVIGFPEESELEWNKTTQFLLNNKLLIDSILPICYYLAKGSIAEKNRETAGIRLVYDEADEENINIAFPNYMETSPNWKEREIRYCQLVEIMQREYPYFGSSSYPKLLYGKYFKANRGLELVEKVSLHIMNYEDEVIHSVSDKLNEGYSIAHVPFNIIEIRKSLH